MVVTCDVRTSHFTRPPLLQILFVSFRFYSLFFTPLCHMQRTMTAPCKHRTRSGQPCLLLMTIHTVRSVSFEKRSLRPYIVTSMHHRVLKSATVRYLIALKQKINLTYDSLIVLPLRIELIRAEFEILNIAEFHLPRRTRNRLWLFSLLSKHHQNIVANE